MKNEDKLHVIQLAKQLRITTLKYIEKNFKDEQYINTLSFLFSAHLNSAFALIAEITEDNPEVSKKSEKFITDLLAHIKTMEGIKEVEVVK